MLQKSIPVLIVALLVLSALAASFRTSDFSFAAGYDACLEAGVEYEIGSCLRELAATAAARLSIAKIERAIVAITESRKRQWCHEFMHYLGWELYQDTGDIAESFRTASSACDSGMYHGIVEEYLNQKSLAFDLTRAIAAIADEACNASLAGRADLSVGLQSLCYHGLGHGFMFLTENDLPAALSYCDRTGDAFSASCYTGAFMENNHSKQVGRSGVHESVYVDLSDPDYPCRILDEKYKHQCYLFQGGNNLMLARGDFTEAFTRCTKVAPEYRETCFRGIGANTPGPHWSTKEAAEACAAAIPIDSRAYSACIDGALSFVAQLHHGAPEPLSEFCAAVEPDYFEECRDIAGENLRYWGH